MTPQRFAAARHVGVTLRSGDISVVDQALATMGLERHVALLVPSTFSALIAASRSDLVACTPERTALGMAPSLGLTLFELPVTVRTEPMRLAWHPRYNADSAHRWLRHCIQRVLNDPRWMEPSVESLTLSEQTGVV